MSQPYDIAIVGGGIVGLATARALLQARPALRLVLLEAEADVAAHQTGHNSGVIHAGLYYRPGSAKAKNCAEGREALFRFCAEQGIKHERCGKVVVATSPQEIPALDELARRGAANGLDGLQRLDPAALREREPHVAGVAGLFVPQTGIVDFSDVARAYRKGIEETGAVLRTGARVETVTETPGLLHLETPAGTFAARHLVNCAGLQCDRVARLCGVEPGLQIIPFRGEYFTLVEARWDLVRNLVYPVPDPRFPFLGVHFTRMVHGGVEAGPNAVLAFRREGYSKRSFSARDVGQMLAFPGFWRMAARHWKTGMGEMWRSLNKAAFVKALQKLLPAIGSDDLAPGGAGVRAQAVERSGALVDDFRIVDAERSIHVLNAPSPAATASLSIGRTLAGLAEKKFSL